MVKVELIYIAKEGTTFQVDLELKFGATVFEAIEESGIYRLYPETKDLPIGIFAKQVTLDTPLREGDRIELYRPLSLDPKEVRRQKARNKK
jgi:putative ubiquitin-RnfH superfamily antitoxin RatB of RatAB toxin-antitoxin module